MTPGVFHHFALPFDRVFGIFKRGRRRDQRTAPSGKTTSDGHDPLHERSSSRPQPLQVENSSSPAPDGVKKPKEELSATSASEMFGILSGTTLLMLEGLRTAAKFAPVPYLGEAADLALRIFDILQGAHGNKKDSQALAEECVSLVFTVESTCKELIRDNNPLPPDLTNHLGFLCETLKIIQGFAVEKANRSFFKRFLTKSDDAGAIQSHREKVKSALDTFALQSQITLRQMCDRILAEVKAIKDSATPRSAEINSGPSQVTSSNPPPLSTHESQTSSDSGRRRKRLRKATSYPVDDTTNRGPNISFFNNASNITGSGLRINNIAGNQHIVSNSSHSNITNSGNAYNTVIGNYGPESRAHKGKSYHGGDEWNFTQGSSRNKFGMATRYGRRNDSDSDDSFKTNSARGTRNIGGDRRN